ncbi:MAG TPA: inorganic phosphate transporter, partial [Myxococcota bacterium]|nr:inorganic phosphate transporter [Myxococcota bacterium]
MPIASKSMTPRMAICFVTLFTFIGPLLGGVAVASTVGELIKIAGVTGHAAQTVTLATLASAIVYNLITWKFGLPNSSTSSLASGLIGSGLFVIGDASVHWGIAELRHGEITGFMKIIVGMVFSPLSGLIVGLFLIRAINKLLSRVTIKATPILVFSQYFSVSWLAFSHGTNDAQKGMGMLAMLLFACGVYPSFTVPWWVIFLCATSITLGTLCGGWKIIKTVGFGLYRIKVIHSVTDQMSSAGVVLASSLVGVPVSTTQVATATLMGIGAGERPGHVKWGMASAIFVGWLLNIPFCIMMGACFSAILAKILT